MRHGVLAVLIAVTAVLVLAACSEEAPLDEADAALEEFGEVDDAEAAGETTSSPLRSCVPPRGMAVIACWE
jgi:hypothetical protein